MESSFLIWNGSPEIFSVEILSFPITFRWYGILFAGGFLASQQILYYIFKREGKPVRDVDTLTVYMVFATILGARLGHVLFYEPHLILENPIGIILPVSLHPFQFTGFLGLASHGGALGILLALWLYTRKKRPGQSCLQVMDRIAIVVAITGAFIRTGNFFNSEILGKPYAGMTSVVFVNPLTETLLTAKEDSPAAKVSYNRTAVQNEETEVPLQMNLTFKPNVSKEQADVYVEGDLRFFLSQMGTYVNNPFNSPMDYKMEQEGSRLMAKVNIKGIARHPAQLYEAISCFLLFVLLFLLWSKKKEHTPEGLLFGIFMMVLWALRFMYEFLKENQVPFEDTLALNMGQILSIPLFLTGVFFFWRALKKSQLE